MDKMGRWIHAPPHWIKNDRNFPARDPPSHAARARHKTPTHSVKVTRKFVADGKVGIRHER